MWSNAHSCEVGGGENRSGSSSNGSFVQFGVASPAGQCERNQSTQQERDRSGAQREALHMRSKELVKHWSNTIAVSTHCTFCICRHNEQYLLEKPHNLR